jgi:hypothetical protein
MVECSFFQDEIQMADPKDKPLVFVEKRNAEQT